MVVLVVFSDCTRLELLSAESLVVCTAYKFESKRMANYEWTKIEMEAYDGFGLFVES